MPKPKKKVYKKTPIIKACAKKCNISYPKMKVYVNALLDEIVKGFEEGYDQVQFLGFGTFRRLDVKGIEITDTANNAMVRYDNKIQIRFTPGATTLKRVNKDRKEPLMIDLDTGKPVYIPKEISRYRVQGAMSGFGHYTKEELEKLKNEKNEENPIDE